MITPITTAAEVVKALGGTRRTADFLGYRAMQRVTNWKKRNRLPPETYFAIAPELAKRGYVAPLELWSLNPPETERVA